MIIDETATSGEAEAQAINDRVEDRLFDTPEPETETEEEVLEDAEELPESDDPESTDEDGSEEEDDYSLAGYLGVDEDRIVVNEEDGSVTFKAVIDGEEKLVPLNELTKSFQLQGHVNNQSMALSEQRKEFEASKAEVTAGLSTRVDGVIDMAKMVEQQLMAEFQGVDWDQLRTSDPGQWSVLRQEFADRAGQIQQMQSLAQQEKQRLHQEQQAQTLEQQKAHVANQARLLLDKNPEWSDTTKMESDILSIRTFLGSTYGFSDEDLQMVTDHRLISLIQDAKSYREGKKTVEAKKAKIVPKFQKPGASKSNATQLAKARKVKAQRAKAKSSGSVEDVASILLDRM